MQELLLSIVYIINNKYKCFNTVIHISFIVILFVWLSDVLFYTVELDCF